MELCPSAQVVQFVSVFHLEAGVPHIRQELPRKDLVETKQGLSLLRGDAQLERAPAGENNRGRLGALSIVYTHARVIATSTNGIPSDDDPVV